jgi:hypothetical protein
MLMKCRIVVALATVVSCVTLALVALLPAAATATAPNPVCTVTSEGHPLWIRSSPSTNASIIGSDGWHSDVFILPGESNGFYQLAYRAGWVNHLYLSGGCSA